ncbi:uncharacterized protein LOC131569974 [Ammospiza caudacuta]|uniref:uncharacterized protein LOC131569974 n=1 Tax=Ammospiza caudacuta TaxID=2857398 RepID=UPI0027382F2B|nr:uncharacterized protein LOC131569974 [Ammospiza caudacuta]
MARAPASAPAPPPWPDSRRAPRGGGPSQPPPRPGTPPQTPGIPPSAPHDPSVLAGTPLPPVSIPDITEPPPTPGLPESAAAPPGDPEIPAAPGGVVGGGSRRVLFADALGLPLTRLRQYRPWDPRGRGGGGGGTPERGEGGAVGEPPPPGIWMRPGKGRPQEAEDAQPPPPEHSTEPDPPPTPPTDVEQLPAQGTEDEAVARELEQLYLSHLRRLRGGDPNDGDPLPKTGDPPFPERAPNTSLANEMALRYEGGGGRCSPPALRGRGGPLEGALVVPARPPPRGRGRSFGGALRGCGVVLALAVLVPVAWGGDGGGPTAAVALGIYLALAWLT